MGKKKNKKKFMQGKMPRKKNSCKEGKTKFMQKEGPIVTFSHAVKKIRAEGFT